MKCVCELVFLCTSPDVKIFIQTDFLVQTFLFCNAYFLLEELLLSTVWTQLVNKSYSKYHVLWRNFFLDYYMITGCPFGSVYRFFMVKRCYGKTGWFLIVITILCPSSQSWNWVKTSNGVGENWHWMLATFIRTKWTLSNQKKSHQPIGGQFFFLWHSNKNNCLNPLKLKKKKKKK